MVWKICYIHTYGQLESNINLIYMTLDCRKKTEYWEMQLPTAAPCCLSQWSYFLIYWPYFLGLKILLTQTLKYESVYVLQIKEFDCDLICFVD